MHVKRTIKRTARTVSKAIKRSTRKTTKIVKAAPRKTNKAIKRTAHSVSKAASTLKRTIAQMAHDTVRAMKVGLPYAVGQGMFWAVVSAVFTTANPIAMGIYIFFLCEVCYAVLGSLLSLAGMTF